MMKGNIKSTHVPAKLGHGVGKAKHAGADHGGDIVEGGVPPLGLPGGVDREPLIDRLLLFRPAAIVLLLHVVSLRC